MIIKLRRLGSKVKWSLRNPVILRTTNIDVDCQFSTLNRTFILAVGPGFNQNIPVAMTVARMGYVNAFNQMGIRYVIEDIRNLSKNISKYSNPFIMYVFNELDFLTVKQIDYLSNFTSFIWVPPLFDGDAHFYRERGIKPEGLLLSSKSIDKIVRLNPLFCFNATTESGLNFFEGWYRRGIRPVSLPLACDTTIYNAENTLKKITLDRNCVFVGGYWGSKGVEIDKYLRQIEDDLTIYGYSSWPYKHYLGKLPQNGLESSLYRSAAVCPVVNEPSVAIMKGQINERVFKVLGSGGCPVVDAVPCYRELYSENELLIAKNSNEYIEIIRELISNENLNVKMRNAGGIATLNKHTYIHRANKILEQLT